LVEAAGCLLVARLAVAVLPFRRLARRLGVLVPPEDARAFTRRSAATLVHARIAEDVRWAITCAARHMPFAAVCLPQAIAGKIMLDRRGVSSVMHFGAGTGTHKPLDAHVWLSAAGVEVTGYPIAPDFTEVGCFV
jgi:hypothetical protein